MQFKEIIFPPPPNVQYISRVLIPSESVTDMPSKNCLQFLTSEKLLQALRLCRAGDSACRGRRDVSGGLFGETPQSPLRWNHQVLRHRHSDWRDVHRVFLLVLS